MSERFAPSGLQESGRAVDRDFGASLPDFREPAHAVERTRPRTTRIASPAVTDGDRF